MGVRGITVRNSASIDSLTSSIHWASSMMKTAGAVRASEAAFTSAVNRRRRASGSIWGGATSGSAMPSRSSSSSRSSASARAKPSAHLHAGGCAVQLTNPGGRPQQARNDV